MHYAVLRHLSEKEIRKIAMFDSSGQETSLPEVEQLVLQQRQLKQGKLSKKLSSLLQSTSPPRKIPVVIWYHHQPPMISKPPSISSVASANGFLQQHLNALSQAYAPIAQNVASSISSIATSIQSHTSVQSDRSLLAGAC